MQESSRRGTRIAHIGIAVRSLDDSTAFYRDVLGLGDVPLDDSDGAKIIGLAAGPSLIELLEAESPESPIAFRAAFRRVVSAVSETIRPFQIASIRSSLLTTCSLLRIR